MDQIKSNPIVLLGVGNILLTDEGFGVHVVNQLREDYVFNPPITILDGGTMGMELLTYMRGMTKLLLVDAINGGDAPGTVYEFPHEEMNTYFTEAISVHEVGMQDILRIRALQEEPLEDAVVIGVEPESLELGLDLSETIQVVVKDVKERILAVLASWNVTATPVE
ncbi:HyaD/HybD family hydrogenase maturation endopeptidase [Veillonella sp. VA139]|uniref:HyaD/HybD family hydrogenase maturation endopeptidase n=1 Tax=Veillonella sp. VA139 TaxID=741830 RepID=UPI000F8C8C73|nr:HyaD/HybD family hydrogenase maturation endopeptidase [Veillonella sp. VA139]